MTRTLRPPARLALARLVGAGPPAGPKDRKGKGRQNRVFAGPAGARVKPGEDPEGRGITRANVPRTLEATPGLPGSGRRPPNAARAAITDDFVMTDVFERQK